MKISALTRKNNNRCCALFCSMDLFSLFSQLFIEFVVFVVVSVMSVCLFCLLDFYFKFFTSVFFFHTLSLSLYFTHLTLISSGSSRSVKWFKQKLHRKYHRETKKKTKLWTKRIPKNAFNNTIKSSLFIAN